MKEKKGLIIKIIIAIVIAVLSFGVISKKASSPEFHAKTIEALEEKRTTVLELSAASALAATGVATIPGDATTPIANKLTDISSYCLFIMCAIYLEKYLLTVTGYAAFGVIIPIACLIYVINLFTQSEACKVVVQKMVAFGLAIFLVVPLSVQVSNVIETTHEDYVQTAMEKLEELDESEEVEEDEGFFSGLFNKAKDNVADATETVKTVLNVFIETVAVMIVTSCMIPIVVMFAFIWLMNIILGTKVPMPTHKKTKN